MVRTDLDPDNDNGEHPGQDLNYPGVQFDGVV